ncbi:MAG: ATP-binding cassette domain-containing protein [Pseudomonadota bacterium]
MSVLGVEIAEKAFEGAPVLRDLRFDLAEGEVAALLGPSGCGKTTLLSLIAGLDTDFAGRIERPEGALAVVFQNPRLLPWRSLAQNIALIPGSGGMARARELLNAVGLAEAADQHPEKVSLGMQRRAALARALAMRPSLVLMDEPLVSLDAENVGVMRGLIRGLLAESGATALITTHDRREALALADRVLEIGDTPARMLRDRRSPLDREERRNTEDVEALYRAWFSDPARAAE